MSRTNRNSKPLSYEYWSARPGNECGGCVGKFTKKQTHKAERQMNKKLAKENIYEPVKNNIVFD